MVGQVMKQHELLPVQGRARVDARMHHMGLGEVSLNRLCYGAEVDINPGPLQDFFLIMMPLQGHAEMQHGDAHTVSTQGHACIASPDQALRMRWSADCDQLMVRISRSFMERMLSAQLGHPLREALRFRPDFAWQSSSAWQCVLRLLVDCAEHDLSTGSHRMMLAHVQELVAATLLAEQDHNHKDTGLSPRKAVLPRHVHRVQEYLQAHVHEPVSAERLAEVAGVSVRGLYAGFQEYCGVSPMLYLRNLRLDQARGDLLAVGQGTSVSGVAMRWGFTHLGRFSAEYKARHGESPSDTLRRH